MWQSMNPSSKFSNRWHFRLRSGGSYGTAWRKRRSEGEWRWTIIENSSDKLEARLQYGERESRCPPDILLLLIRFRNSLTLTPSQWKVPFLGKREEEWGFLVSRRRGAVSGKIQRLLYAGPSCFSFTCASILSGFGAALRLKLMIGNWVDFGTAELLTHV